MIQDWDIKPRSRVCGACRHSFHDGETYYTRLVFGAEGYARADYCDGCWQKQVGENPKYSSWQGTYRVPQPEPDRRVNKETAETLLRAILTEEDPARVQVTYILALMLERQKVFVEREIRRQDDGAKFVVYEHRKTGETFLVRDPQLQFDQLAPVQQEVMRLLASAGNAVAQVVPAPGAAAAGGADPAAPQGVAAADTDQAPDQPGDAPV